jgi:hypothetical protein
MIVLSYMICVEVRESRSRNAPNNQTILQYLTTTIPTKNDIEIRNKEESNDERDGLSILQWRC